MNFLEAVKAMKEGKKVKARFWKRNSYIYSKLGGIKNVKDELAVFGLEDFEATDWEIVEEKPEDWTDLKTILDWRTRMQERYNTGKVPPSVMINETLKAAIDNNFQPNIKKFDGVKIIVKKKTLSDKIEYAFMLQSSNDLILMGNPTEENKEKYIERGCIPVDDVKEAIKEFIEKDIKLYFTKLSPISNKVDMDEWNQFVDKKAFRRFGERLT